MTSEVPLDGGDGIVPLIVHEYGEQSHYVQFVEGPLPDMEAACIRSENLAALAASCEDASVGLALASLHHTAFVSQGEGGEQGDGCMSWLYGCV